MAAPALYSLQPATATALRRVIADPALYSTGILQHTPWTLQREIMRAVRDHRRVAVKACHSSGKTFTAGDVVLWWLTAFREGIVITTAPTWTQVEKLMWGRIHAALRRSRIRYPKANKTELYLSEDNYAMGISTNEADRFQGWHGDILLIVDEAPGVRQAIFEAIEGIRAGGRVHLLLLGNPIVPSGPFYDAFNLQRARWKLFTISAFDTPNLAGMKLVLPNGHTLGDPRGRDLRDLSATEMETNPVPYLTTRAWVLEKFEEWGLENPLFESKVLGQFPTHAENSLVPLAWIEESIDARGGYTDFEPLDVGIDVAGPGEAETSVTMLQGPDIKLAHHWPESDPRGKIVAMLAPYKGRIRAINVDSVGIGYFLALHLRDIFGDVVRLINVGTAARNPAKFVNLRAELMWAMRMRFQEHGFGRITDQKTQGQVANLRYDHDPRGRVRIESKDDARKDRGVPSPDRAESLMLAAAPILPAAEILNATHYPRAQR